MKPTFADHALRGEVHDMRRLLAHQERFQSIQVVIKIDPFEANPSRALLPFVGEKGRMRFL